MTMILDPFSHIAMAVDKWPYLPGSAKTDPGIQESNSLIFPDEVVNTCEKQLKKSKVIAISHN